MLALIGSVGRGQEKEYGLPSSELELDKSLLGQHETHESYIQSFKFCNEKKEDHGNNLRYLEDTSYRIVILEEVKQKGHGHIDCNTLLLSMTILILFIVSRRLACNQVKIVSKLCYKKINNITKRKN